MVAKYVTIHNNGMRLNFTTEMVGAVLEVDDGIAIQVNGNVFVLNGVTWDDVMRKLGRNLN